MPEEGLTSSGRASHARPDLLAAAGLAEPRSAVPAGRLLAHFSSQTFQKRVEYHAW